ncbi:hypothetical protein LZ30DRAFT_478482, partial [Colletotrichum cereale]
RYFLHLLAGRPAVSEFSLLFITYRLLLLLWIYPPAVTAGQPAAIQSNYQIPTGYVYAPSFLTADSIGKRLPARPAFLLPRYARLLTHLLAGHNPASQVPFPISKSNSWLNT